MWQLLWFECMVVVLEVRVVLEVHVVVVLVVLLLVVVVLAVVVGEQMHIYKK